MDTYTPLLERTRLPQPSLQKYAVTAIFSKLRSAPPSLGPSSEPGRRAISQCLHTSSPPVADQSARELCRLVADSRLDISIGLLELQSALEGSDPNLSPLFVKSLGFLSRLGFQRNPSSFRFSSSENHPFVKILSCGAEVEAELVKEVVLFMGKCKGLGMERVCEFVRPFVNLAILRVPFSGSSSYLFARSLVLSMAAFCCSFPEEGLLVLRMLSGCFKFLSHKNSEELRNSYFFLECVGDAYVVVLRHLVGSGLLVNEAQVFGVELAETILSLLACDHGHYSRVECIVELVKRLLEAQKVLDLPCPPELSSTVLSLVIILLQAELEHEQLSLLRLLIFLLSWKNDHEIADGGSRGLLQEELLLTLPVIHLLSSASSSVKGVAADLLVMLEKLLVKLLATPKLELNKLVSPLTSSPGYIVYRLLHHLWSQDNNSHHTSFFISFCIGKTNIEGMHNHPIKWVSVLREYSLWIADLRRSTSPISRQQETFVTEMPLLLSAIASTLVMHQSLGNVAIDLLAAIGGVDPKQGVTLLLCVLFYCNIFSGKVLNQQNMLPKLLSMLPSLASLSVMIPLIVQTIKPMLQKDRKLILYGTGTRLLCQTWAVNDRAFESLQAVLHPKSFSEFKFEEHICLSIAASVRDVCKKSPDRGVDLILSVSACIESRDQKIQALGFQSLSHLCEADVIDFYTAWEVILKHLLDYSTDPVLAQSLCLLLKWGAIDAEAYQEASTSVLTILWDIVTYSSNHAEQWVKARASAFEALTQYQVLLMEKGICDFKRETMNLLLCETEIPILKAMEELQVKIIMHEHVTRRRFVKEKKVPKSKMEKLLDVVPHVLFPSGTKGDAKQFPGAALLCLSFTIAKDVSQQGLVRVSPDVCTKYKRVMVEVAVALQLSRNIFFAIYSLQSWKSFMRHWMRANTATLDAKALNSAADKTTKAATDILKSLMQVSEESIPRAAENIMLAIGALCLVLPPSDHTVKSSASKFLLNCLFQHEHEHRQWSAALSLGLISSCLHVTDHKQKFENITGLLEVLHSSKSILVKGACSVGLGFSCQDLLTGIKTSDNVGIDKESYKMQEIDLLAKIISSLLLMTAQISEASYGIFECLSKYFPQVNFNMQAHCNYELLLDQHDNLEEDIWGVAGLASGLGNCIGALYRAGAHDLTFKLKELIISWIPHVDSLVSNCNFSREAPNRILSVGSCLVLSIIVAFSRRVEVMNSSELDYLLDGFIKLISELLSVNNSGAFHQSLLMASCIGAGNLLCCILNEGVHPVEVDCIKHLLDLFRQCYSGSYHPFIRFGGMLGVVNAMGAGAGILLHGQSFSYMMESGLEQKESGYIQGNLLSSPLFKSHLETLIQEIFLVSQNSDDLLMQQYAAWVISFLRNTFWSREFLNVESGAETNVGNSKTVPHSLSEDCSVVKLSEWLSHLSVSHSGTGTIPHVSNVSTVLRCLSRAPRLPAIDWGSIIRRCMKYEDQVLKVLPDSALMKGTLREQCLQFSLAHANQFNALLSFLDELSNLSRFRTLELNLQSCLLFHLAGLVKVFSGSRLDKLFDDIVYYFSSESSYLAYNPDQRRSLRISCWSGLYNCLDETSLESTDYISNFEKCMEVLFELLPSWESTIIKRENEENSVQEWHEAVKCFALAPAEWLLKFLQVPSVELVQGHKLDEFLKKIVAKAKMARMGCVPLSELGSVKSCILNLKSNDVWNMLIEVVAALQSVEGSVKRQWLVDAIEISCVSRYPSTAVQFFGLLAGSCCKYMPVLTLDDTSVLNDLPVTVASILSEPAWQVVADSVVSSLWTSTERLYDWTTCSKIRDDTQITPSIDESEENKSALLLRVMHQTCVSLKEYLPLEKQLRLANMCLYGTRLIEDLVANVSVK